MKSHFCVLGKYGDIIQLLPVFKACADQNGFPTQVETTPEYGTIFEGVSYVRPVFNLHMDWKDIPGARQRGVLGVAPQWWLEQHQLCFDDNLNHSRVSLQFRGKTIVLDATQHPNYAASMWHECGFRFDDAIRLPLVFDRRCDSREAELFAFLNSERRKQPMLLIHLGGESSAFAFTPEILNVIHKFPTGFQFIYLDALKAHRIYDLLGLYDRAVGLITTDTATLHLAPASKIPYVAFTNDGWQGSIPRGNCVLNIKYSQALERRSELAAVLKSWL